MARQSSWWDRYAISRRTALKAAAATGGGALALSLVGCSSDDEDTGGSSSAGGGTTSTGQTGGGSPTAAATKPAGGSAQGKPGGKLNYLSPTYPLAWDLMLSGGQSRVAGLTHSGLMAFKAGVEGVDPSSLDLEPDAAQALPEQPDETTFTFKLRPGIKFHNGREMTSEDVRYSFDRYANFQTSIHKAGFAWIDQIETPDAQTVTFKSKGPNADALWTMAQYSGGFILLKEHEEGPEAKEKLVGSGPYVWDTTENNILTRVKKNPDYFLKPYPYIDELTNFIIVDDAKKVADFISKQVQFTFHNSSELASEITKARPEAKVHVTPSSGFVLIVRVDEDPYKDKRVRQALSRSVDRQKIIEAVEDGVGEPDSALSWDQVKFWGPRNPKELKSAANWKYDPASAKQLLSAAGITSPISMPLSFTNAGGWQAGRDTLVLAMANWKENGIADYEGKPVPGAQFTQTRLRGMFSGEATSFFSFMQPIFGTRIKQLYWSPASGPSEGSPNSSHLNDSTVNSLIDKNLSQFKIEDRRKTIQELDELMGEEQYRPAFVTRINRWFTDPSVKNASVYNWAQIGTAQYLRKWWLG